MGGTSITGEQRSKDYCGGQSPRRVIKGRVVVKEMEIEEKNRLQENRCAPGEKKEKTYFMRRFT